MVEPEWDPDTRNLVLAREALPRCPVCGRDPAVCQDPQRDWAVDPAIRCHPTTALLEAEARFTKDRESEGVDPQMRGLMFPVRLVESDPSGQPAPQSEG